jgi:DNA-binding NarL/FixJ family response regulator
MTPIDRLARLSPSDRRIVALIGLGRSERQIAEKMSLTEVAVAERVRQLVQLLGVGSPDGLASLARSETGPDG